MKLKLMNRSIILFFFFLCLNLNSTSTYGQYIAVKTNALEWAIASPNIGFEFVVGRKLSVELSAGGNFLNSSKRINYVRLQPEVRYWFERPLVHHFVGLTSLFAQDNIHIDHKHFDGDLIGAGVTYGYNWVLGERWNIEATLGIGVVKYRQFKWKEGELKPEDPNDTGVSIVPIKAGLSLSYIIR